MGPNGSEKVPRKHIVGKTGYGSTGDLNTKEKI